MMLMRMFVLTLVMMPVIALAQIGSSAGMVETCKEETLNVISNATVIEVCLALPKNGAYQMPNGTTGFCYVDNIADSELESA